MDGRRVPFRQLSSTTAREFESSFINSGNRLQVLSYCQIMRLLEIMSCMIPVHSSLPYCPTIHVSLKDLLKAIKEKLIKEGMDVKDIRLLGGAAASVIGSESSYSYNDFDVQFSVNLSTDYHSRVNKVKAATLHALADFLPSQYSDPAYLSYTCNGLTLMDLQETYIHKLFRVMGTNTGADCWSLIGLGNTTHNSLDVAADSTIDMRRDHAKCIEIKFVHSMKRSFEFTVDSFQIILDSLLTFYETRHEEPTITPHFYPTVVAESVAGSFQEAAYHLNHKLISTQKPEEIHGGGLLKYCRLLTEGYRVHSQINVEKLEKYMCSRFFIDHSKLETQRKRIISFLNSHFSKKAEMKMKYLRTLQKVIRRSSVCLMSHERSMSLNVVAALLEEIRQCSSSPSRSLQINTNDSLSEPDSHKATARPEGSSPMVIHPTVMQPLNSIETSSAAGGGGLVQWKVSGTEWVVDQVYYGGHPIPGSCLINYSPSQLSPPNSIQVADAMSPISSRSVCPSPCSSSHLDLPEHPPRAWSASPSSPPPLHQVWYYSTASIIPACSTVGYMSHEAPCLSPHEELDLSQQGNHLYVIRETSSGLEQLSALSIQSIEATKD